MKIRSRFFRGPKWLLASIAAVVAIMIITVVIIVSADQLSSPQLKVSKSSDTTKDTTTETPTADKTEPTTSATTKPANTETPSTPASGCNSAATHINPAAIDVLANKKHCLVPKDFAPTDLVTIHGATISAKAADAFEALYQAAVSAGQGFAVSSSYRSYNEQVSTYDYWVSVSGQAGADTYSSRPGFSEHQTGLAVDLEANGRRLSDFTGSPQAAWLAANAYKYGFIERYPAGYENITGYEAESWHYRYIGISAATDMHNKGVKTLEQYWGLSGGGYQ